MELRKHIVGKIGELTDVRPEGIRDDDLLRDLGVDSLMHVELLVFIEKTTKMRVPEESFWETVGDVISETMALISPIIGVQGS